METLTKFSETIESHARTLEMAGLNDMVRGLRLAEVEAKKAIADAVAEATAPKPRGRPTGAGVKLNLTPEERARRAKFMREVMWPRLAAKRGITPSTAA